MNDSIPRLRDLGWLGVLICAAASARQQPAKEDYFVDLADSARDLGMTMVQMNAIINSLI
jgi:hypothetical protein